MIPAVAQERVSLLTPARAPAVRELLVERLFGRAERLAWYWDWQLTRFPALTGGASACWVVTDARGTVTGCLAAITLPVSWFDQVGDFLVPMHLAARRGCGGPVKELLRAVTVAAPHVLYSGSGNPRVQAMLDELTTAGTLLGEYAYPSGGVLARWRARWRRRAAETAPVAVARFPETWNERFAAVAAQAPVRVRKDSNYLNWRYAEFPLPVHHRWLLEDDRHYGWLVIGRAPGSRKAYLLELAGSEPAAERRLLDWAVEWCREHGVRWLAQYRPRPALPAPRRGRKLRLQLQYRTSWPEASRWFAARADWNFNYGDSENSHYFFW